MEACFLLWSEGAYSAEWVSHLILLLTVLPFGFFGFQIIDNIVVAMPLSVNV